jgi:arylsulfatase A-like enzyme
LVLITVDCLRADHVGFLGYHRPTTPFLDTLAAESFVFSDAIVAGSPTYYSFPAIMASRYPLSLGRDLVGLAPGETTLASVLNDSGYATAAFLAGNPYLSPRFGYDAGFQTFEDFLGAGIEPLDNPSQSEELSSRGLWNRRVGQACHQLRSVGSVYDELYFQYSLRLATPPSTSFEKLRRFPAADVLVDRASHWLATLAGMPFFLWLHFMDPHAPYYPPQQALEEMQDGDIDAAQARYLNSYWNRGDLNANRLARQHDGIVALYDAGIRWVDTQVARLVTELRSLRVWDNCLLALTADHGEEFLEHGGRYHPPNKFTEELIRVPLLVRAPRVDKMRLLEAPFSLIHTAPTLLDALNVPLPGDFKGRSHWARLLSGKPWDGDAIVECVRGCTNPFRTETRLGARLLAVRESRFKLVLDFSNASHDLFDLQTDPGEHHPLPADAEKQVRRRLLEKARRHVGDSFKLRDPDRVLAAQLRDLQLECTEPAIRICA